MRAYLSGKKQRVLAMIVHASNFPEEVKSIARLGLKVGPGEYGFFEQGFPRGDFIYLRAHPSALRLLKPGEHLHVCLRSVLLRHSKAHLRISLLSL